MSNLFRAKEIGKRFDVPYATILNWSKAKGTWRHQLYVHLEKVYAKELAELAKNI